MGLPKLYTREGGQFKEVDTSLKRLCEAAKGYLDMSKEVLTAIYGEGGAAPQPLREVIKDFVDGKLTKEGTIKKLDELGEAKK